MIADVFCKIIKGELPSEAIYRDDDVLVIKDINPKAPVHLLIIPVRHYEGIADCVIEDPNLMGKLFTVVREMAIKHNLEKGYRVVINAGPHGGQLVPHLHIHLLGGHNLGPKIVQ